MLKTDYEMFGAAVGPGWHKLVEPLIEQCKAEGATILQIKEKFGGLRFYVSGASDDLQSKIERAEADSCNTCEECGEAGKIRGGGWLRALCDRHAEGREPIQWPSL